MTGEDDILNVDRLREEARLGKRHGGNVAVAYSALQQVVSSSHAKIQDYFSAGECALRLNLFSDAISHLIKVISSPIETNSAYYIDQSYAWRAYAFFKLNKYELAASDVAAVSHVDTPYYVLHVFPEPEVLAFTAKGLQELITAAATGQAE